MSVHADEPRRKTRGRSPSYPGIALDVAIERAATVYKREGRNAAPMSAITANWGYKSPDSGPASVTYAALKKFGLLEEEGSGSARMGKLTRLALDILMHPEPQQQIREAALRPPIHQELWAEYGPDLPSDATLRHRLVAMRGFTERGFEEFIDEYRRTIAFAGLDEDESSGRSMSSVAGHGTDHQVTEQFAQQEIRAEPSTRSPLPHASDRVLRIPIPLIGGSPVIVEGEFPISESAWVQLLAVLNAMKPGLVEPDVED